MSLSSLIELGLRPPKNPHLQGLRWTTFRRIRGMGAVMGRPAMPYVVDVREATFSTSVIDQSGTVPVVLDLWASWCGPCQQLTPILERLAVEFDGRFLLGRVDVDAEQRIAQAFQVQSIPSVFAVIAGQPIPLFQGALDEGQVRSYLDEMLKVAAENGVTGRLPRADGLIRPIRPSGSASEGEARSTPTPPRTGEQSVRPVDGGPGERFRLFVSHASGDSREAASIVHELTRAGIGTWLATRDVQVGENYAAQIYNAVVESTHLLVLLSPASVASQHVQREVNLALDQGKVILPLIVSPTADFLSTLPAEWKYWLGVVQVIPYSGAADAAATLLRRLEANR